MAELKRVLGFWPILFLSITSIMGTTLYFSPSIGAELSGVSSIIAWVFLTIIGIYISFLFGELVSLFPRAGGVYEFSKHAYNRFTSFIIAWIAWLLGNLTTALMIVAAIRYLLPGPSDELLEIAICVGFIILLNVIAYFGVELSVYAQMILAIVALALLFAIIAPSSVNLNLENLKTIFPIPWQGIFLTMFVFAEGFFGWEAATYLSEETKNPQRIIPRAIIIGTILVGCLSTASAVISFGLFSVPELLNSNAPLSLVFVKIFGSKFSLLFGIGVFLSLIGAAASGIITMPRLILALARDKLFIAQFSDIHKKFQTPYKAIIFQTVISLAFFGMAFGNYKTLLYLVVPLGFIMYFFIIFAVLILRFKEPYQIRLCKAPFGKTGIVLVLILFAVLIGTWLYVQPNSFKIVRLELSFILVGVPIYFLLMFYYNPDVIIRANDILAIINFLTERFMLPKALCKKILGHLGDIRNKTILEFGCGVGTLTMHLAAATRPFGKIYATDLSSYDLKITSRRLTKRKIANVTIIHDEHQVNRVHPSIPRVDAIVSVGMMSYLQDVRKVLHEMRELLPYGGKVVFMEYVDFFKVIPNVAWLGDDARIEQIFRESGFGVFVTRKKSILWNYVFVYGVKV